MEGPPSAPLAWEPQSCLKKSSTQLMGAWGGGGAALPLVKFVNTWD